jgi:hypothetical protein
MAMAILNIVLVYELGLKIKKLPDTRELFY